MVKIYGFNENDAKRIKDTVKRFENWYRTGPANTPRAKYPVGGKGEALVAARITSSVTAGSEATPTSFNFVLMVPADDGTHGFTAETTTRTGYNRAAGVHFTASSGSPKSAWLRVVGSDYYLVSADC